MSRALAATNFPSPPCWRRPTKADWKAATPKQSLENTTLKSPAPKQPDQHSRRAVHVLLHASDCSSYKGCPARPSAVRPTASIISRATRRHHHAREPEAAPPTRKDSRVLFSSSLRRLSISVVESTLPATQFPYPQGLSYSPPIEAHHADLPSSRFPLVQAGHSHSYCPVRPGRCRC